MTAVNKQRNCFKNIINLQKIYKGIFLFVLVISCLIGCGSKEGAADKNGNSSLKADKVFGSNPEDSELDKIVENLLNNGIFEGEMAKVNHGIVIEAYGLSDSSENLQIYASYMSTAAKADEITVIKTDNLEKLERYVQEYIEARKKSFESYMPGEVKKLEEVLTVAYGKDSGIYIICISGSKKEALKQITVE